MEKVRSQVRSFTCGARIPRFRRTSNHACHRSTSSNATFKFKYSMRGGTFAGVALATVCGALTSEFSMAVPTPSTLLTSIYLLVYTTLQPALQQQKEEREGIFNEQHASTENQEKRIGRAIASDFKEAREEVEKSYSGVRGGFAWGIRQALFGTEPKSGPASKDATAPADKPRDEAKEGQSKT